MSLIERWHETLDAIINELATSTTPIKSNTFSSHVHAMRTVLFKFETLHHHLVEHLDLYREMLRTCRAAIRSNNRQLAIATIRYLKHAWLPTFAQASPA